MKHCALKIHDGKISWTSASTSAQQRGAGHILHGFTSTPALAILLAFTDCTVGTVRP